MQPSQSEYPDILAGLAKVSPDERKHHLRYLIRNDLYFLIRYIFKRADFDHPWLFDRCREVEALPNNHIDLWSREHYKDLCDKTPMLTVNRGWTTHGELVTGDVVFSPSGNPVAVQAVTPQYTDSECYQLSFDDGSSLIAGAGHLWRTRQKVKRRIKGSDLRRVEFVEQIRSTESLSLDTGRKDVGCAEPLHYPVEQLIIHPYVLGAWLGDGHTAAGRITCEDDEVWNKIKSFGYELSKPCAVITRVVYGLSKQLRAIGVLGNKHIPDQYLKSSVHQRMELLRGLMDTDGHCNTRGTATFCQKDEKLSRQVYELATGLGLKPRIRKYNSKFNGQPYQYWQVSFQAHTDRQPFFLLRKANRAIEPSYYRGVRTITKIERVPSAPTRCIQVEGGMYLAGKELIPTHNSTIITYAKTIQDILCSHGKDAPVDKEITVGIFSHTRPIAKGFMRQIKRELEQNEPLKEIFDDVLWQNPQAQAPKWSEDDGLIVQRRSNPKEGTIEAWGVVDGQPISKHFDLLIYDDVVTAESVNTPEMIDKTMRMLELSYSLGANGGARRFIGTRYHFNDPYRTIMARGTATPRIYAATKDGTMEGEPVLLTREQLTEKRRDAGPYTFASQYMQNPKADETQGFKEEWIQYHDGITSNNLNVYMLFDAASGKKKGNDYTAGWVIGLGEDENFWIIDMVRDRLNLEQRGRLAMKWHRKYRPMETRYEKYGLMADIEYIESLQKAENYRFPIKEMGGQTPKNDRIRRLLPYLSAKRFIFPRSVWYTNYEGRTVDLVQTFINEEYLPFPVAVHDDMLDSLARIIEPEFPLVWPESDVERYIPIPKPQSWDEY